MDIEEIKKEIQEDFSLLDSMDRKKTEEILCLLTSMEEKNITMSGIWKIRQNNLDVIKSISKKILFYIDFFNNTAIHSEFRKYTDWFSEKELDYIVCRLNLFLEKVIDYINHNMNYKFDWNTSIWDVLWSGPINIITMIWLIKDENKEKLIENLKIFQYQFEYLLSYIKILCHNPKKLKIALLLKEWCLFLYKNYFLKTKNNKWELVYEIPKWFNKIRVYFFFHKYAEWNIGYNNLEEELKKISIKGVNIEKIIEDFPDLKIWL